MSENPASIKRPLTPPRRGDPIRAAQIAALTTRLMALERQVAPGKPNSWKPPVMVKITGRDVSLGPQYIYTAVEVRWQDGAWHEQTGGRDFSNSSLGPAWEIRWNTNVPIDTIVQLFQIEAGSTGLPSVDNRVTRWVFEYAEHPVYMPFKVERASSNRVVVGANRNTLAESGDTIEGREVHVDGEGGFGFLISKTIPEYKTVTEDCWLYYHIDMSNKTASLEIVALKINQLPGGDSSQDVNWPLAYIKWSVTNSEIESIQQLQFGRIWIQWWRDPASLAACSINHQTSLLKLINDATITELDATGAARLVYGFQNSGNWRGWAKMEDVLGDSSIFDLGGITNIRVS